MKNVLFVMLVSFFGTCEEPSHVDDRGFPYDSVHPVRAKPNAPEECNVTAPEYPDRVRLKMGDDGKFQQPLPDGRYVSHLTGGNSFLMDLQSGKLIEGPGQTDPFPTPDGKFIFYPEFETDKVPERAFAFVKTSAILKHGAKAQPVFRHPINDNGYHSVGMLESNKTRTVYRVMHNSAITDFEVTNIDSQPKFRKLNDPVHLLDFATSSVPMISKNGKMFGAYHNTSQRYRIYKINADRKTQLLHELPFKTSKVNFSYDGTKIAFHSGFEQPGLQMGLNLKPSHTYGSIPYIFNIETGEITALGSPLFRGNAYYPGFQLDGRVTFVKTHWSKQDLKNHVEFVTVNPERFHSLPLNRNLSDREQLMFSNREELIAAHLALGALWARICGRAIQNFRPGDALFIPSHMNRTACRKLITKHWNNDREWLLQWLEPYSRKGTQSVRKYFSRFTKENLIQLCPK